MRGGVFVCLHVCVKQRAHNPKSVTREMHGNFLKVQRWSFYLVGPVFIAPCVLHYGHFGI